METDGRRSSKKPLSAFALATVCVGIIVVGASSGWAAHGLVRTDPTPSPVEVPKRELPVQATSASMAPPTPPPPAMLRDGGVALADTPLVHRFLARSVRCGRLAGADFYASVLDFLKLRTKGVASPPFHYEVRSSQRDGYDYVVIREAILKRDGSPFPGARGYVVHTYYYDAPINQFELVSSVPEDPSFNRAILRELGNPLGFMVLNWEAVCNGARHLHRDSTRSGEREGEQASAQSAAPTASGVGQWTGSAQ